MLFLLLYLFPKKYKKLNRGWVGGVWPIRVFLGFLDFCYLDLLLPLAHKLSCDHIVSFKQSTPLADSLPTILPMDVLPRELITGAVALMSINNLIMS